MLRLQVRSPVRAATSPTAAQGASRLVAVRPGGFTAVNPLEQRPSLPETSMTDMVKLEINIVELKLAQCGIKTCIQI